MAKKKKILFIMPSLEAGGAEKSLVNLIEALDQSLYDIHVLLFEKKGIFLSSLPSEVTVLEPVGVLGAFSKPLIKSIGSLRGYTHRLKLKRLFHSFNQRIKGGKVEQFQKSWKLVSDLVEKQEGEYDVAIGYLEMWPIYFAVEKIDAKVKIGVIHTNYSQYGMDKNFDAAYFNELDHLLTVSEVCRNSLIEEFPHMAGKIGILENIISERGIFLLAEQEGGFRDGFQGTRLLTIGRLDFNKGYDLAIEACKILIDQGFDLRWYAIGEGPGREKLMKAVKANALENHFIFLGSRVNPYPYLKQTDLYIHPSRLEGKSLAVEEAKILRKPIVVTAYENVLDQIADGVNGIIVNLDAESLAAGIGQLLLGGNNQEGLSHLLPAEINSNEEQVIEFFNSLIEKSLIPS